jgi:hypothetical protein
MERKNRSGGGESHGRFDASSMASLVPHADQTSAIPSMKELGVSPASTAVSQQEAAISRRLERLSLLLAALAYGFLSGYLRTSIPPYAVCGISMFVGGLVSYPSLGRQSYGLGQWTLRVALFSASISIFVFAGALMRRWW